jgi:hypothetical protein
MSDGVWVPTLSSSSLIAWVTVEQRLRPLTKQCDLISPRVAIDTAGLLDTAPAAELCESVMASLGFRKARLARLDFYIRKTNDREKRHESARSRERARELADGRTANLREQLRPSRSRQAGSSS